MSREPVVSRKKAMSLAISAAFMVSGSTFAAEAIEEIIVTAQKRAESIQDVPIAVSAFGEGDLEEKQIDTGIDLQNYVPNLNYQGSGSYSIRGVGAAVGGTTGDVGVGIHVNNVPLIVNRTTTGELFDVERVEVLRGPQGTLYGRNATGGVINFLPAKPNFDELSGSVSAEYGSYSSTKLNGFINLPAGELFSFRLAGSFLKRDGYTDNIATGNDIDGRDLFSTRLSVAFEPNDIISSVLSWEHFEEDSTRNGGTKAFCINDPGPTTVGSTAITNPAAQLYLSRGCQTGSIYDDRANGNFNSVATFGGRYAFVLPQGFVDGDVFRNEPLLTDPREVSYYIDPEFVVENDFISWDTSVFVTDELQLNLLLGYAEDKQDTRTGSRQSSIGFNDTALTPGGFYTDFQGGTGSGIRTLNMTDNSTEQFSAELRLQSDFSGPVNFNLGAFYFDVERENILFIATNSTSLFAQASGAPLYFDTNQDPSVNNYDGHQYFVNRTPYELNSNALFGEVYWDINDELKLTAGIRHTTDKKETNITPVLLFVFEGANGIGTAGHPPTGSASIRPQSVEFKEWTGRLVLDWTPDLGFTDETLIYASYSPGYKAGGFNSPDDPNDSQTFTPYEPEFVKAFEIGTKNLFADGLATLNLTAFYYDYKDYQVSFVEQFSTRNTNVDATVIGLEVETAFDLSDSFTLSANLGWQDSEIKEGSAIDPFDRINGVDGLTYLVTPQTGCVVSTAELEPLIALINANILPAAILANVANENAVPPENNICSFREDRDYSGADNPLIPFGIDITPTAGVATDLKGNELPNSPSLSLTIGGDYTFSISDWDATIRADYSWKDDSYTSPFNGENYELRDWQNMNISFILQNFDLGITVQAYAKNVLNDNDTVVGYDLSGQGLGLARNATLLDPRLFGVNVRYDF
ncbi:MAG: TonB-dependent receptor [Cellvibrionaceae bacterium]